MNFQESTSTLNSNLQEPEFYRRLVQPTFRSGTVEVDRWGNVEIGVGVYNEDTGYETVIRTFSIEELEELVVRARSLYQEMNNMPEQEDHNV